MNNAIQVRLPRSQRLLAMTYGFILLLALFTIAAPAQAATSYQTIVESGTPLTLDKINTNATADKIALQPIGNIITWTSLQLLGKPYAIGLLDRTTPEYLYISLDQTDCMLFIEEVVAVSQLLKEHALNIANLTREVKHLRYHGAVCYCNRNHYFKDWALANIKKGIFVDEALRLTHTTLPYSADVMSAYIRKTLASNPHAQDLSCIARRENLINHEALGFIPLKDLPGYLPQIKSGDIIGIIRTPHGRADSVHHLGIAYVHGNIVSMIHASSDAKKVIISDTLLGYLARFKDSQGIILLRTASKAYSESTR